MIVMYGTKDLLKFVRIQKFFRLSSTSTQEEIIIPNRIERGPTDILKALASTVATDYTAPHYGYHDDPYLIPYHAVAKRDYRLSKQSGRDAARYILEQHSVLFERNRIEAEPPITAFQPRSQYNESTVTVDLLQTMIQNFQVEDSLAVYKLLIAKKKEIPKEVLQSLLELTAFYNEEDGVNEETVDTLGMVSDSPTWNSGGIAEKIYSQLSTSEARLALLGGLARHSQKRRARQVWEEITAAGDRLSVLSFNSYLACLETDDLNKVQEDVGKMLKLMVKNSVLPNAETLVSILKTLATLSNSKTGKAPANHEAICQYSLALIAEFRNPNIPICLGAYKYLVDIFLQNEKSGIVGEILSELEGKSLWPAVSLEDLEFFPRMMRAARFNNSLKAAYQLHDLLLTGDNTNLLADFRGNSVYYQSFLSLVLRQEKFPVFIELYTKITPHIWTAGRDFYTQLLAEINAQGAVNYIGKIYDDMVLGRFGGANKEKQHELSLAVLKILVAHQPSQSEFENLSVTWVDIAKRIFRFLDDNKAQKGLYLRFNTYAADICSLAATILLREGEVNDAFNILSFCMEEKEKMPGQLSEQTLTALIEGAVNEDNIDDAMKVIDYSLDINKSLALELAMDLINKKQHVQLQSQHKDVLNKMFLTESKWVPI